MKDISPKYIMNLINEINKTLWDTFDVSKYKNVKYYIQKRQRIVKDGSWEGKYNFDIIDTEDGNIDLLATLHGIKDFELILRIAIDLGIETPGYIPAVSQIKNDLKDDYPSVYDIFIKSFKMVEDDPDVAIGLSNSALESIVKNILSDERIDVDYNSHDTLYKLAENVLKEIGIYPGKKVPKEINKIGSGLLKASQGIEELRSSKTFFHGKAKGDVVIKESSYAYFVVNAVTTIGLFLLHFYEQNFNRKKEYHPDDLPF